MTNFEKKNIFLEILDIVVIVTKVVFSFIIPNQRNILPILITYPNYY